MSPIARVVVLALMLAVGGRACQIAEAAVGEMDISWTDTSGNEDGFAIERAVGSGGVPTAFVEIGRTAAGVQSFIDKAPALVHNTQYCYRVRAFNAGGFSAYGTVAGGTATFACAIFQTAPPPAPSNVIVK